MVPKAVRIWEYWKRESTKMKADALLIPNHDYSYNSHPKKHRQELIERSIKDTLVSRPEPFGHEMVDGDVDEHATGEAHGNGVDPVGNMAFCRRVDGYPDSDPDGAGDGEREGIRHGH